MKSGYLWFLAVAAVIVLAIAIVGRRSRHVENVVSASAERSVACSQVAPAFHHHRSGSWLSMSGRVVRTLADSNGASVHQRFILGCRSGQTVLVDNNVDVGSRVPVHLHELVVVRGQYIWNKLGGLMHDTHHSTDSNPNGWIFAGGRVYQ